MPSFLFAWVAHTRRATREHFSANDYDAPALRPVRPRPAAACPQGTPVLLDVLPRSLVAQGELALADPRAGKWDRVPLHGHIGDTTLLAGDYQDDDVRGLV